MLIRWPSPGTGPGETVGPSPPQGLGREDLRERIANKRSIPPDGQMRDRHEDDDDDETDYPEPAGRSLTRRIEEGLDDSDQAQCEQEQVEQQEGAQDLRRDDPGEQTRRRLRVDQEQGDHEQDQRGDQEEGRQPRTTV